MTTLAEAQAQLVTINSAISEFLAGTRRRSLKVGSREFNREIAWADINLEDLLTERRRLENMISALTTTIVTPTFRQNTSFPLNVTSKPV